MKRRVGLLALTWAAACLPAKAADPDALWKIVSGQCVPNETAKHDPAPCAVVNPAGGYAVLKDRRGATQYLLIPTTRISGIESPDILAPSAPNFWDDAWRARNLVEARAGRTIPRDEMGMAINSPYGRSQNQLHIHVDCVRVDVRNALKADEGQIGAAWTDIDGDIVGHHYRAMRLEGDDLGDRNPFKLLADGDSAARADMARETLAVIGATFPDGKNGFVLLASRAEPTQMEVASSETLLDHDCAVLKQAP